MIMAEGDKKKEFWRWTESNWKNPTLNWEDAKIVTAGIDVGSVSSQAVIVADGKIFAYSIKAENLIIFSSFLLLFIG